VEHVKQAEVIVYLADKLGIGKKLAGQLLDELNALVVSELKSEGSIRLGGLGIFRKRKTEARAGRNPATGETIRIPARTRLGFTFCQGDERISAGRRGSLRRPAAIRLSGFTTCSGDTSAKLKWPLNMPLNCGMAEGRP
jgi:DNA-binding protein HU-beta